MQKTFRFIGKTIQILTTVLLAFLLACNLYLIIMERIIGVEHPTIFGYSTAVIVSGSMEPALSVDDMILNHRQNSYEEGDIITFQNGNSLTTHRIVEVTEDGYLTKGDANNTEDSETIHPTVVIGRVVCVVPVIGNLLTFLKTPLGMLILIFTGFCIVEVTYLLQRPKNLTDGGEKKQ